MHISLTNNSVCIQYSVYRKNVDSTINNNTVQSSEADLSLFPLEIVEIVT